MKILEIRVMKGPNFWSIWRHKLIVMKLDLEEKELTPTNKIPGFPERLEKMFPGMFLHRCSESKEGGFFHRVREGTWLGHVVEHIALEIQTLAGMDVGFGRTRETKTSGIYNVVFAYMEEQVGKYAAEASVHITESLRAGLPYDLDKDIQTMRELRERVRLGPSTQAMIDEAASRDIPFIRLNRQSLVQLGYGINQKRIRATITSQTGSIGVDLAGDKEETKLLLGDMGIPVPRGTIVFTEDELKEAVDGLGFPLVTKPVNGNHGKGATTHINQWEDALKGFHAAQEYSQGVIIERFIPGYDHRLLVINYKFVAGARRTPAMVIGDGKSSIQQLMDKINADPRRGYGHEKVLTQIRVDQSTNNILQEKNYSLQTILKKGEVLTLKLTANISTGGTAEDVTDMIHPYNIFMAERISRIIGLDICGIDIMTTDISLPLNENNGAILEVNAAPGFRMHVAPTSGLPRNVAEPVIDMLYPPGSSARIPIIAVTGTNGKTTTTRLIAHIIRNMGYKVGFTTTDGIYIQNQMLVRGDCTGPMSTEFVLRDPTVDFAVLEVARGGILRAGLGFHKCNVAVVTNVAEDHLGLKDIDTIGELARVKAVVVETVLPSGHAILNADDDLVYQMKDKAECNLALFSMDENNPRIVRHCQDGGLAAIYENGYITICKGNWKIRISKVTTIPLTFSGKALFMIQNILPAVLAGFLYGAKPEDLRSSLETFIPSAAQTPGRMNHFQFRNFQVLIDYAHNPAGFQAIANYLEKVEASPKIGIITGIGDRRDVDIQSTGRICATIFDEIIIRQDRNLRGRNEQDIINHLKIGIAQSKPNLKVTVIPDEEESIRYALDNAVQGSYIVICTDVVPNVLELVMKYKEEEDVPQLAD